MWKTIFIIVFMIIFSTIVLYGVLYYQTIKHKNYKKKQLNNDYYKTTIINLLISVGSSILIILMISRGLNTNIQFPNIFNILSYFLLVDTIFYWVHRITHRTPFLKEILHSTHHQSYNLVPLDLIYIDHKEHILYTILVLIIPLLFIKISSIEFLMVNSIIYYHAIMTHSETNKNFILPLFINSNYHKYHHQIGRGNYGILFPIWDNYMGTRIPASKIRIHNRQIKNKNKNDKNDKTALL